MCRADYSNAELTLILLNGAIACKAGERYERTGAGV